MGTWKAWSLRECHEMRRHRALTRIENAVQKMIVEGKSYFVLAPDDYLDDAIVKYLEETGKVFVARGCKEGPRIFLANELPPLASAEDQC